MWPYYQTRYILDISPNYGRFPYGINFATGVPCRQGTFTSADTWSGRICYMRMFYLLRQIPNLYFLWTMYSEHPKFFLILFPDHGVSRTSSITIKTFCNMTMKKKLLWHSFSFWQIGRILNILRQTLQAHSCKRHQRQRTGCCFLWIEFNNVIIKTVRCVSQNYCYLSKSVQKILAHSIETLLLTLSFIPNYGERFDIDVR